MNKTFVLGMALNTSISLSGSMHTATSPSRFWRYTAFDIQSIDDVLRFHLIELLLEFSVSGGSTCGSASGSISSLTGAGKHPLPSNWCGTSVSVKLSILAVLHVDFLSRFVNFDVAVHCRQLEFDTSWKFSDCFASDIHTVELCIEPLWVMKLALGVGCTIARNASVIVDCGSSRSTWDSYRLHRFALIVHKILVLQYQR